MFSSKRDMIVLSARRRLGAEGGKLMRRSFQYRWEDGGKQCGSASGHQQKFMNTWYILEVELPRLSDRPDVRRAQTERTAPNSLASSRQSILVAMLGRQLGLWIWSSKGKKYKFGVIDSVIAGMDMLTYLYLY